MLQLLPPGHADGPSSASPGKAVVGQLEKVVQHGADCVALVAVPLVVREPQPQLLGRHVAAAPDGDVAGRSRDGLARRLLLRYVDRRGGCCRPRGPRSTSGARALRRPCPCSAAGSSRARARHFPSALGHLSIALGGAAPLPGGLLGEAGHAPRATLAKKKAIWNPQNEDQRCFTWCVLAHCLGVEGLTWQERKKTVSCSGPFFYPKLPGRRGRRPAGWQPALADAEVDFSGLPTDRPVNFDDIEAFELRNAGRVEVFVFAVDGRAGVLPRPPAARPEWHGRRPTHRAASSAQRPLHDSQLPGAGQQAGADPGSHAHQHRRLRGVQEQPCWAAGRGHVGQLLQGPVSRYAAVMPTTVQSDSGKRERSSATSNFVLMAAIMVPARADGDAGLTIHSASLRK